MARNWLRLVLAAAVALAMAGPLRVFAPAEAQTTNPPPKASKKTAKKAADAEPAKDEQGQPKKKKQDPAEAQKAIEAAQKLIEAGKAEPAVASLTATLNGGLPPGMMARALLYRGTAQRQLQRPAQAIQDLTQALWIKGGLNEGERAEGLRQRSAAYADAGVGDGTTLAAISSSTANRVASNDAVTTGSNTQAGSGSSGSGWNIFGNLFGASPSNSPPPAPAPKMAAPAPAPTASGWSSQTEVKPQVVATAPQPVATAPMAAPPAAAPPEGKFRIQLGLVRSEGDAGALASRVSGEFASVFEARRASIDQTVVGNMGTMYRVRVGPYASAQEGQAVCGRLKGTGLDCLVVTQ